jgi:hypothetical protein
LKVERIAPVVAGLLLALPVLFHFYPPMHDLPYHEEIVALMRHRHELYTWNLGHPNQLFHFLALPLAYAVSPLLACKIVLALAVALLPVAASHLAGYLGASRWSAVAVAPLAVGFAFYFGLVGNVLVLPIFLSSLPALDRYAEDPSWRRGLVACGLMLLLYAAHESGIVCASGAVLVFALVRRGWPFVRLVPAAFASVLAALQLFYNKLTLPPFVQVRETLYMSTEEKITRMPRALLGFFSAPATVPLFFALLLAVVLFAVGRRDRVRSLHHYRFELVGLGLLAGYLVLPFALNGATWVHVRLLAPAWAILCISAARGKIYWPARVVAACLPAAFLLLYHRRFTETSALFAELEPLIQKVEQGSAVAHLDASGGAVGPHFPVAGGAARIVAARGGRALFSFPSGSSIPPLRVPPRWQWNEPILRLDKDALAILPAHDLQAFKYLLVYFVAPITQPLLERALAPDATLIGRSGRWLLFQSAHATRPLLSPDTPVPPGVESLVERVKKVTPEVLASQPN